VDGAGVGEGGGVPSGYLSNWTLKIWTVITKPNPNTNLSPNPNPILTVQILTVQILTVQISPGISLSRF